MFKLSCVNVMGAIEKSFYVGEPLPNFFQSVDLVIFRALRGRAVVGQLHKGIIILSSYPG